MNRVYILLLFIFFAFCSCEKAEKNGDVLLAHFPLVKNNSWTYKKVTTFSNIRPQGSPSLPNDSIDIVNTVTGKTFLSNGDEAWEVISEFVKYGYVLKTEKTYYDERDGGLYEVASNREDFFEEPKMQIRFLDRTFANIEELFTSLQGKKGINDKKRDSVIIHDPPYFVFKYPLEEGSQWVYEDKATWPISKMVLGKKKYSTPAGQFDCFELKWTYFHYDASIDVMSMMEYVSDAGIIAQKLTVKDIMYFVGNQSVYADLSETYILQSCNINRGAAQTIY